jgi:hypothetical protein
LKRRTQFVRNSSHKGICEQAGTSSDAVDLIYQIRTKTTLKGADMSAIALATLLVHTVATLAVAIGTAVASVLTTRH